MKEYLEKTLRHKVSIKANNSLCDKLPLAFKGRYYGLFGFLDEWIKRGFYETPEEITHLFWDMIKGENKY